MSDAQSKIRNILYSIFAGIIGIVLIRVFLKLLGVNPNNEFADFWYTFSQIFVDPWKGIYGSIETDSMIIEVHSIVAVVFYLVISMVVNKSAASAFEDSRKQAIVSIVDSIFKIIEALLITRFIFKLTGASVVAPFVRLVYDFSSVIHAPFATLLPQIETMDIVIEISTIVALIVFIILDLVTESLTLSLLDALFPDKKKPPSGGTGRGGATQPNPFNPAQQQSPSGQNITINLPPNQTQPTYVDQRSINVAPNKNMNQPQRRGLLNNPKKRSSRAGGPATS